MLLIARAFVCPFDPVTLLHTYLSAIAANVLKKFIIILKYLIKFKIINLE